MKHIFLVETHDKIAQKNTSQQINVYMQNAYQVNNFLKQKQKFERKKNGENNII